MREIKFRAWDKVSKVLIYGISTYSDKSGNSEHIGFSIYDYPIDIENLDDASHIVFGDDWAYILDKCDYVIEQFTGLHDKNGKEIYEGDIVRYAEYPRAGVHVISWNNGVYCGFIATNENGGFEMFLKQNFENCEVIGNIHENMEKGK